MWSVEVVNDGPWLSRVGRRVEDGVVPRSNEMMLDGLTESGGVDGREGNGGPSKRFQRPERREAEKARSDPMDGLLLALVVQVGEFGCVSFVSARPVDR